MINLHRNTIPFQDLHSIGTFSAFPSFSGQAEIKKNFFNPKNNFT